MARNVGREIILDDDMSAFTTRVIGFDCSSKTVGWGVIGIKPDGSLVLVAQGHIRPLDSKYSLMERLNDLFNRVGKLCEKIRPDIACIEDIAKFIQGGGSSAQTITLLAAVNRVTALAIFRSGGKVDFMPVSTIRAEVRKAMRLKGRLVKEYIPDMIRTGLDSRFAAVPKRGGGGGEAEQTLDEADAIAAAWAYIIKNSI